MKLTLVVYRLQSGRLINGVQLMNGTNCLFLGMYGKINEWELTGVCIAHDVEIQRYPHVTSAGEYVLSILQANADEVSEQLDCKKIAGVISGDVSSLKQYKRRQRA